MPALLDVSLRSDHPLPTRHFGAGPHVGPDQTVASFVAFCLQGAVMPAMNLRAASTCKVATQGKDPNMSGTALSSENPGEIALPWSNVAGMMTS